MPDPRLSAIRARDGGCNTGETRYLLSLIDEAKRAIRHVEADLMGNADDRTRGTFTLVETRRLEALFALLAKLEGADRG